jgi:carbonic anhydrase
MKTGNVKHIPKEPFMKPIHRPFTVFSYVVLFAFCGFSEIHSSKESGPNPNETLEMLLNANMRFVNQEVQHPHQQAERRLSTARDGQKPVAAILSCSDSRVPVELVFDMGIGDLFVVRVAGNVADRTEIGSLEYSIDHLGTRLVMVIGHTKCGAVTAVAKKSEVSGNVLAVAEHIAPAVDRVRIQNKGVSEDVLIQKAIKANIWQSIEDIFKSSEEIRNWVKEGKVKIVGALYDIETGKITNLGVHAQQEQLFEKYKKIDRHY